MVYYTQKQYHIHRYNIKPEKLFIHMVEMIRIEDYSLMYFHVLIKFMCIHMLVRWILINPRLDYSRTLKTNKIAPARRIKVDLVVVNKYSNNSDIALKDTIQGDTFYRCFCMIGNCCSSQHQARMNNFCNVHEKLPASGIIILIVNFVNKAKSLWLNWTGEHSV